MKLCSGFFLFTIVSIIYAQNVPDIPTDFTVGDDTLSESSQKFADEYAEAYLDFMKTGIESSHLKDLTQKLFATRTDINWVQNIYTAGPSDRYVACTTCRAAMKIAARMFRSPKDETKGRSEEEQAKGAVIDICRRFNVATEEICTGYFNIHWPVLDFIITSTNVDSNTFCEFLPVSYCKVKQPEFNWTLNINKNGVNIDEPKSKIARKSNNDLKILHITDLHYDPEYQPGALAVCEEPLCCERMPTEKVDSNKLAGYWGDYHTCDAPLHLINNALDHINKTHRKIDYIYHTGDVMPHIGWKSSEERNKMILSEIDDLIYKKFPNIKVFPCLGNHDSNPSDLFSPEDVPANVNTRWLYEHIYNLWSKWLPEDTKETILKGGYYTVSPHSGFRVISLNNLDCYLFNWWLYYNGTYAIEQLEWLHDTLLAAETAGEYVHILTHVPTGARDCWVVWSREFNRLIERFHLIIGGIFNGHTHKDELNVYYTPKGHAINVAWNAGSITTFVGKNPNYRIYDVESHSMQVVDFENWTFNLTAANAYGANKDPEWFKLSQFSEDFTRDLSPAGMNELLEKMAEEPDLLRKYWKFRMTNSDPNLAEGCDNNCMKNTICEMATYSSYQKQRCNELQAKLDKTLTAKSTITPNTSVTLPENSSANDGASFITSLKVMALFGCFLISRFLC